MPAENKLSDKKIRSLLGRERERQVMIADGKGMSARVSKKGVISFVYQFRLTPSAKTTTWLTLGRYPDLSLSAARQKRDKLRALLAEGRDPRYADDESREKRKDITVRDAIDFWNENYVKKKFRRPKEVYISLAKHVIKPIGNMPLNAVTGEIWANVFDNIAEETPVAARHMFSYTKQALSFCNLKRFTDHKVLNEYQARQFGEPTGKRERVLSDKEVRDVWFYVNKEKDNEVMSARIARVMFISLVFGCRISEAILSTWEEWDFHKWIWTVPKKHSKNGMEIVRPIPKDVRGWVKALKTVSENHASIIGFDISQPDASSTGRLVWKRLGHSTSWHLHDFRRTIATRLADMDVDHYVIEQLLGHKLPGVMGVYNRSQQLNKKAIALDLWVKYLDSLLDDNMLKIINRADLEKMP